MIGKTLAHYKITGLLGKGGMGEVYLAEDTQLKREVALKVLPAALEADPDRLARFQREAELLAALNHPHIAQIYGIAGDGARSNRALVMELVEGPTLAERIERGAVPIAEVLSLAQQLAEALDYAHERGIVHRDLKPANVKLTEDGKVKVLDFGLAKAYSTDPAGADSLDTANSQTLTHAATRTGMVLGTPAYMSPEQARVQSIDKRADIWAFGCVLYEMLAGRRAFEGATVADLLVAIMSQEPDWTAIPNDVPGPIQRLIRRCLEKDPKRRLRDIGDALTELESGDATGHDVAGTQSHTSGRHGLGPVGVIGVAVGGLLLGVVGATMWSMSGEPARLESLPMQAEITIDPADPLALDSRMGAIGYDSPVVALSPDGRYLVYVAGSPLGTSLRLRDMTTGVTSALPGTEGAFHAVFSPDGLAIAFLTRDRVKRIALAGGSPVTLCEARSSILIWWPDADVIYFTEDETWTLSKVAAGSPGASQPAVQGVVPRLVSFTDVLAGGRTALAVDRQAGIGGDYTDGLIVDLTTGATTPLPLSGYGARFVEPGYLLYGRSGNLMSMPFDALAVSVTGPESVVASNVAMDSFFFQVHASASANGLLAYAPGADLAIGRLAWVERANRGGQVDYLPETPRLFGALDLSPDGTQIAIQVGDVQDYIYVHEADGPSYRVPADRSVGWPAWSRDGRQIVVQTRSARTASATFHIFPPERPSFDAGVSLAGLSFGGPRDWSPTEDVLALMTYDTGWESSFIRVGEVHHSGMFDGYFPTFSPDGRFVAYASSAGTNALEIYIRSYPDGRVYAPFSLDGGTEPFWNHDTRELFYRRGSKWFVATVTTDGPEPRWTSVRLAFDTDFIDTPGMSYAVSPDGQRLLVVKRAEPIRRDRLSVVTNWQAGLSGGG